VTPIANTLYTINLFLALSALRLWTERRLRRRAAIAAG